MQILAHVPGACGVDEAGRGALAGPVVCAAVMIPDDFDCAGLDDSKKLTEPQRITQAARIKTHTIYAIAVVPAEIIDEINILQATFLGMQMCLKRISQRPSRIMIDGNQFPRHHLPDHRVTMICSSAEEHEHESPQETVIKGDGTYACIAAASILAKTTRDQIMREHHPAHPLYGFDSHVGYAAPTHLAAIHAHGPCAIHRRSFDPVRTMLAQPCLFGA